MKSMVSSVVLLAFASLSLVSCADPNKPPEHPDNPIPQEPDPSAEMDPKNEDSEGLDAVQPEEEEDETDVSPP